MKQLQNDFTTPEQSKRLLDLGVPADSANGILRHYTWADCILDEKYWESPMVVDSRSTISITELLDRVIDDEYDKALPCWSVGRLIEIGCKCWNGDRRVILFPNIGIHNNNIMEYVFRYIEIDIQLGCLNFSKLEE